MGQAKILLAALCPVVKRSFYYRGSKPKALLWGPPDLSAEVLTQVGRSVSVLPREARRQFRSQPKADPPLAENRHSPR